MSMPHTHTHSLDVEWLPSRRLRSVPEHWRRRHRADGPVACRRFKCHLILLYSVSAQSPRGKHPGHNVLCLSPTPRIRNVSTAQFTSASHTPESHFPVCEAVFVLLDPPRRWINSLPPLPWVKRPCPDYFLLFFIRLYLYYVCVNTCLNMLCSGTAGRLLKVSFLGSLHKKSTNPLQPFGKCSCEDPNFEDPWQTFIQGSSLCLPVFHKQDVLNTSLKRQLPGHLCFPVDEMNKVWSLYFIYCHHQV